MKALSLYQPYATLIALGAKRVETRSWAAPRSAIGQRIAIHASARCPGDCRSVMNGQHAREVFARVGIEHTDQLPFGAVLCTVRLVECRATSGDGVNPARWVRELSDAEREFGGYTAGRFGWFLADLQVLATPIPAKGRLGLWEWDPDAPPETAKVRPVVVRPPKPESPAVQRRLEL